LPWALRTRTDETGAPLIPKGFRIELLCRRRDFIALLGGAAAAVAAPGASAAGDTNYLISPRDEYCGAEPM
jgi:hypothetical protein